LCWSPLPASLEVRFPNSDGGRWNIALDFDEAAAIRPDHRVVYLGGPGLDGCLAKVEEGEPIFVLRSTDSLAPTLVRNWCDRYARKHGLTIEVDPVTVTVLWGDVPEGIRARDEATCRQNRRGPRARNGDGGVGRRTRNPLLMRTTRKERSPMTRFVMLWTALLATTAAADMTIITSCRYPDKGPFDAIYVMADVRQGTERSVVTCDGDYDKPVAQAMNGINGECRAKVVNGVMLYPYCTVVVVDVGWAIEAAVVAAYPPYYLVTADELVWKPIRGRRKGR